MRFRSNIKLLPDKPVTKVIVGQWEIESLSKLLIFYEKYTGGLLSKEGQEWFTISELTIKSGSGKTYA